MIRAPVRNVRSPLTTVGQVAANAKTPRNNKRGVVGETVAIRRYEALTENLPRSVFLNRASFPLVLISRSIAEYTAVTMLPKAC